MKKLLLSLLFFTGIVNAQIVNIPDANFKAKLLSANTSNQIASTQTPDMNGNVSTFNVIDTNADGEIQVSEAQIIKCLYINNSQINDLTGIEAFTNLQLLNCSQNYLQSLNVSELTNLQHLFCYFNQIASLDVSSLTNLIRFLCYSNQIANLDVSNSTNLTYLICNQNQLQSLNISGLTNLRTLDCKNNQLTSLDVSNLINLTHLNCYNNQITGLDVSNLTS